MRLLDLARRTWTRFDEQGDLLAAAIAFYTLLSVAPLVVIAVTIAGWVFDPRSARGTVLHGLERLTSPEVAATFLRLLEGAEQSGSKLAGALAVMMLLWAASRLFVQMQQALNLTWGVRATDAGSAGSAMLRVLIKRLISFVMVIGCAVLLLVTLAVQSLVSVLMRFADSVELLARISKPLLVIAQGVVIPLMLLTPMLALIYHVLPDAKIRWRDVWVGALFTAVLLLIGTGLLALLLNRLSPAWLQGAIGSIAVFMLWTYYLAQVFLLGAAFTRVWSQRKGEPEPHAEVRAPSKA